MAPLRTLTAAYPLQLAADPAQVSVVVLTFNEASNIASCLQSVAGWCQEVHVVDSGSTDDTVRIARNYTQLIHFHPYVDHASQLSWVLQSLPLSCEWLLLLDADHVVTEQLRTQITTALAHDAGIDGYYCVHRQLFRGKPVHIGNPRRLRLVKHRHAKADDSELVDGRLMVPGKTGYLSGQIVEVNTKEDDIDFWVDKQQKYSTRMAAEEVLRRAGYIRWSVQPRLIGNSDERVVWLKNRWYRMPLYVRPLLFFTYRYFWKRGFLDGLNGFIFHFMHACWLRLLVDIKISDIYKRIARGEYSVSQLAQEYQRHHLGNQTEKVRD